MGVLAASRVDRKTVFTAALAISNLALLIGYPLFLKERALSWAAARPDPVDAYYYSAVFENLEYPVAIAAALLTLAFLFRTPFANFIKSISPKQLLVGGILLACVGCTFLAVYVQTVPISDAKHYLDHATRLFETGRYISNDGTPTAFWPVGYPALLAGLIALVGKNLLWIRLLHVLLYVLLGFLVFRVFRHGFTNWVAALTTAGFLLSPNILFSPNALLAELPFLVTIFGVFAVLVSHDRLSWGRVLFAGVLTGVAILIKPIGVVALLPAIWLVYRKSERRRFARIAVLTTTALVVLSPWIIRNSVVFESWTGVATNGGLNLLIGNHAGASGKYTHDNLPELHSVNEALRDREAMQLAIEHIVGDPVAALARIPKKLFYSLWRGDAFVTWSLKETSVEVPAGFKSAAFYFANLFHAVSLLGLLLMLVRIRRMWAFGIARHIWYLLGLGLFTAVAVFFGSERFLLPILPFQIALLIEWLTNGGRVQPSGKPLHANTINGAKSP
ncbi:MAG: hypothetical protein CL946_02750 [Ectothiorhodospiraceae bacterium]|nr:hypothetical protein [Ectothiorhodospiraceae bacterium]